MTGGAPPQDAFVAGLLSHLGRATFATSHADEYQSILSRVRQYPQDLFALEEETFGIASPALAAVLLRQWYVPEATCSAIELVLCTTELQDPLAKTLGLATLAGFFICPDANGAPPEAGRIFEAAHQTMGLTEDQCVGVLSTAATEAQTLREILEVPSGQMRTAEEIQSEVRERIAELTLAVNRENQLMAARQEDLLKRATTDPLTGIGNRAALEARLTLELDRAARSGKPLALLMIDVDCFKGLNDTFGHQAGDQVLRQIARTLDENIRKVDYVARYGGEESVVVAPITVSEGARVLAERLREAVETQVVRWEGQELATTVSVGVRLATEVTDSTDAKALLKAADDQMYKAKRNGRNRVEIAQGPGATPVLT